MFELALPAIIINFFIICAMIIGFVETRSPVCILALLFLVKLPEVTLRQTEAYPNDDESYEIDRAESEEDDEKDDSYMETRAGFTGVIK